MVFNLPIDHILMVYKKILKKAILGPKTNAKVWYFAPICLGFQKLLSKIA